MRQIRKAFYFKTITIILVCLLFLQTGVFSQNEQNHTLDKRITDILDNQFDKAKNEYRDTVKIEKKKKEEATIQYAKTAIRLERLKAVFENIEAPGKEINGKEIEVKEIESKKGQTLLLLGVCREKLGDITAARENYTQAKKILGSDFLIDDLELKGLPVYKEAKKAKNPSGNTGNVIPVPGEKKAKSKTGKFLLIAGAVVIVGVIIYLLLRKPPKRTLTVTVGEGINGSPASGATTYKKGAAVNYNYSLQSGYTNLVVKLDGNDVATNGQFKMYSDHTLTVSATKQYTLTVTKGTGVNGTPESCSSKYNPGETINYNYSLQNGYKNLAVMIDGVAAPASGSITMDKDRTLTASATQKAYYTLTVTRGTGVNGTPSTGTNTYVEGTVISYNYTPQTGYKNLIVTLNGAAVSANSSFTMDKSRTLSATASKIGTISNVTIKITITFAGANIQFTHKVEVDGNSQIRQKYIYLAHYTTDWEKADKYTESFYVTRGLGDTKIKQIAYTSDLAKVYPTENSWLWWTSYKVEVSDYQFTGGVDPGKPTLSKDEFELNVGPWNTPPNWVTEKTEDITISAPSS